MLASDAMRFEERGTTERVLGVEKTRYVDVQMGLALLCEEGFGEFYCDPDLRHIDRLYNLVNGEKLFVGYNHPFMRRQAIALATWAGYEPVFLPLQKAMFAAVGFAEVDGDIVVDCRAEATMEMLREYGCSVVATPSPLVGVNKRQGSLHCVTREMVVAPNGPYFKPPKSKTSPASLTM
jgi:hypothetical protein